MILFLFLDRKRKSISLLIWMTNSFGFCRFIVIPLMSLSLIVLRRFFFCLMFNIDDSVITNKRSYFQLYSLNFKTRSIINISCPFTCSRISGSRARSSVLLNENDSSLTGFKKYGLSSNGSFYIFP